MYVYSYKYLNLVCYDISQYNFTEKGQRRWLLLKTYRTWDPGSYVETSSDFPVTFSVPRLLMGIKV